jgi:tetratricopeptide (TPR) repeat protein
MRLRHKPELRRASGNRMRYTGLLILPEEATLRTRRLNLLAATSLVVLQACAAAPPANEQPVEQPVVQAAAPEKRPVADLTLNLPEQATQTTQNCACTTDTGVDRTFLDKGFSALAAGDHREAVNYFRRYQRLESSPVVDWEANIAIAYDKMLPESPYYNWRAARESYLRLLREQPPVASLHQQVVLMRDALAIFSDLHVQINDLQKERDTLSENLEKREEALRRLRELTLGQKGATP